MHDESEDMPDEYNDEENGNILEKEDVNEME
jgi:hypothetical protein